MTLGENLQQQVPFVREPFGFHFDRRKPTPASRQISGLRHSLRAQITEKQQPHLQVPQKHNSSQVNQIVEDLCAKIHFLLLI
ncbi:hypothetical protein CBP51_04240 [Cellvibrio mixtus]|uniref:Uncharacterized protein n=1 Tax=Cellvibrio mixtus TaxID=39650 RepID=A0A266Q9F8_9GAMM|nr:hypothetical protein [Cellvibrio mixtus]OZY86246.1 hypothetical protein CBP51_04240 [Cellvibrio mixtus]